MTEIFEGFGFGIGISPFIGLGFILACSAVWLVCRAVYEMAIRPHDTRPNGWMALMHYNQLKHIERMSAPPPVQQFVGTALPSAPSVQVIDGTISSQWPTRAMVVASQRTGVQIGGQE
jgi:hypothetical protein